MFGSNEFAEGYWGQGAAEAEALQLKTVTASVSTTASISSRSIVNQIVTATITTVGSITRLMNRTVSATLTTIGLVSSSRVPALNVIAGYTKFLTPNRVSRFLTEATTTKPLAGLLRITRRSREE